MIKDVTPASGAPGVWAVAEAMAHSAGAASEGAERPGGSAGDGHPEPVIFRYNPGV